MRDPHGHPYSVNPWRQLPMSPVAQEFRNALRTISAQPGFSALVVGVLAAGLACVMFMLVVLNALVIKPLPFAQPENLLHLGIASSDRSDELGDVGDRDLLDWRRQLDMLAEVGGFQQMTVNLGDAAGTERYAGAQMTSNLLDVLRVVPQLGRGFVAADGQPGAMPTVLLSDTLWRNRFNADVSILGRTLRVNARDAVVIGVMPAQFSYPYKEQVWLAGSLDESAARGAGSEWAVVARLRDGTTTAAVSAALSAWRMDAAKADPVLFERLTTGTEPLSWLFIDAGTRNILNVMLLAVLLVLLVACANAANLMLTRALARRQELAVRSALGASRARLVLQLLCQSLLLSMLAAAIALPLGWLGAHWVDLVFRTSEQDGPPAWMHFSVDGNLILLTVLAALGTGLITGLLPALRAGSGVNQALRDDSRAVAGGAFARISRGLVIGEIAMSCVLLVSAGVMVRGINGFAHDDFGIQPDHLLSARVGLPESTDEAEQVARFERITERLRNEPGIVDAAAGTTLPGLIASGTRVIADGAATDAPRTFVYSGAIDDHFAATYGLKLEQGRLFDARDHADSTPVAIVDRSFAERFGEGGPVPGRRFVLDPDESDHTTVTVVGVIARTQLDDLDDPVRPALLVPMRQQPARFASLAVRTVGDPEAFAPRLIEIVRELEPDAPSYWVRGYERVIAEAVFGLRVVSRMFTVFGLIALFLAATGLYGVLAFTVRERTREIGVRRALGAPARQVLGSLVGRGGIQVGIGLLLGLALGWPFARLLVGSFNGFDPTEPLVYVLVFGMLALVALLAILVPARRALRIDPVIALRHE